MPKKELSLKKRARFENTDARGTAMSIINGSIMSTKMKAAQISNAGGDWELIERDIPEPDAGQVRVKVDACGIWGLSNCFVRPVT